MSRRKLSYHFPEHTLYMVVDLYHNEEPLFVGTMKEVCEYTGKTKNAILSAISHSKARGGKSRYIRVGTVEEDE